MISGEMLVSATGLGQETLGSVILPDVDKLNRPVPINIPPYYEWHLGKRSLNVAVNYWSGRLIDNLSRAASPLTNLCESHVEQLEQIALGLQFGSAVAVMGSPLLIYAPGNIWMYATEGFLTMAGVVIGLDIYRDGKFSEDNPPAISPLEK